ncbi:DUF1592 domain-containing protein [Rubinisphaera margarita]|uniref:DUF1592 domain-containing protein n=1 Tax=Rubinisphaera margarita TaxID=2909586 RepID=UPI001EE96142|nr:DUF1592 domain-containing protein [Rubinisphaera margarita]MCG6156215.1 DUF1592 domain-containing protein [Rubinisphaera margarita]
MAKRRKKVAELPPAPLKRGEQRRQEAVRSTKRRAPYQLILGTIAIVGLLIGGSYMLPSASTGNLSEESARIQAEPKNEFATKIAPFLSKYCADCHGADLQEEGIRFDNISGQPDLLERHDFWHKVHQQIAVGSMPPSDMELPSMEERTAVADWLDRQLNHFDCRGVDNPGRVTVRRLNRIEYNNTVRDLLGINVDLASTFPADDVGYGFDNIGDVLTISPLLMERYIEASEKAVDVAITLPESLRLKEQWAGERFKLGGSGRASGRSVTFASNGFATARFRIKAEGEYQFEVVVSASQAGDGVAQVQIELDGKPVGTHDVPGHRVDRTVKWNKHLKVGDHQLEIRFANDHYDPDAEDPQRRDRNLYLSSAAIEGPEKLSLDSFPAAHRRLMVAQPGKDLPPKEAARKVLAPLVERAFRRPTRPGELDRYLKIFEIAQSRGESYERSMQVAIQGVLVSPEFLFRIEGEEDSSGSKNVTLDDFALASRLSYFLWSSMPDDELFALARSGKLSDEAVLEQQVRRMLKDEKSQALTENFIGQWLGLRRLPETTPDKDLFPMFNTKLATDMQRETELLFAHVLEQDLSLTELITADYTFVNESLARLYGLENIKGNDFQKVSLKETPRRGLIAHAGVLTLTSFPNRTSPVKRGEWVLENILAQAPPPAPASVPGLEETQAANPNLSFREQLVLHQKDPICSSCHKLMDGIGFGLQNFDAIGRWREKDGEHAIDAQGDLPDGTSFNGPSELIDILSRKPDDFTRCMAEKMLTYAVGRGLEWYDRCTIDDIIAATRADHYRISRLIVEIVKSPAFRERHTTSL